MIRKRKENALQLDLQNSDHHSKVNFLLALLGELLAAFNLLSLELKNSQAPQTESLR
jgi:hypothetical protein